MVVIRIDQPQPPLSAVDEEPRISNFEGVASYNWLDESDPTILVPGIPPIWSPPANNPSLKADASPRYVDQNADRNPWSPTEPLIRAVQTLQPKFDFASYDIISDRRPLRKLYGFASGELEAFEFSVEIVGTTSIFSRMNQRTREEIPKRKLKGYRDSFEEAYTKLAASAEGSTSHHRVVCYSFDGLKFLTRFAVDAYIKSPISEQDRPERDAYSDPEDGTKHVKAIFLGSPRTIEDEPINGGVKVIQGGQNVPHEAILELITRSANSKQRSCPIEDKMVDIWLSQTPTLVLAYHPSATANPWQYFKRHGEHPRTKFNDINMNDMKGRVKKWEIANAQSLKSFSILLRQVIEAVRTINRTCIVSYAGSDQHLSLEVFDVEQRKLPQMPDDLRVLFDVHKDAEKKDQEQTNAESGSEPKAKDV